MNADQNHSEPNPHERVDPYEGQEAMWSGDPNQVLVREVAAMPPGRAVDVGAGEGADAVWLARQGWRVTALEPSPTALRRARRSAHEAGVEIDWVPSTLADADLPAGSFDLVSVFYPALFRTPERAEEARLARLVAPGGRLLVVTHADVDRERALSHGFDPDSYVDHAAFREALGPGWSIEVDERRTRDVRGGGGAHHHADVVLLARRDGDVSGQPDPRDGQSRG